MEDTFYSISESSKGLYKEKSSKFIAYAFPVEDEEKIKEIIKQLKKEHHSARHYCYAWRLGFDGSQYRTNDDGEPSATAGKPILGVITGAGLTNILIVVVRYFGGVLLGVSGLINAYRAAAGDALKNAEVVALQIETKYRLSFDYDFLNKVMSIIKAHDLQVSGMEIGESCEIIITAPRSDSDKIIAVFCRLHGVTASKLG